MRPGRFRIAFGLLLVIGTCVVLVGGGVDEWLTADECGSLPMTAGQQCVHVTNHTVRVIDADESPPDEFRSVHTRAQEISDNERMGTFLLVIGVALSTLVLAVGFVGVVGVDRLLRIRAGYRARLTVSAGLRRFHRVLWGRGSDDAVASAQPKVNE